MAYYHCLPTVGLTVLKPGKPASFEKPAGVYPTTLLPMALMYAVRNYEYSYGYTKDGQIYFDEYFPNALEILYRRKSASLYLYDPESTESTGIPNEAISETAVPVSVKPSFRTPAKRCWSRNDWEPWLFIDTMNCQREC